MTHPCEACCYWKGDSMWKGDPCAQGLEPGSCAKPWQRCPFCEQAFTDDKCLSDALARIAALESESAQYREAAEKIDAALVYLNRWGKDSSEPNWRRGDLIDILQGVRSRTGQPHD